MKVENLSKQYRLGNVGLGSLGADVNRWWHTRILGNEDPYLKIGEENDREVAGTSGYVWALQDINFDVQQGEVLGIIGRNGAGKSTLLKILSRTTGPTTGSIKIKGRVASLLEVGTGFHPELTGRENIFLNGAILGMTKQEIRSKFDEIVAFAGVERYVDTPVKRYSSGMYVRLAFAVAAHLDPEILIVDEVLAVGDVEFQKKAIGKMKEVSEGQGRTVLFVSHNMEAISKLTKNSLLLDKGRIIFNGKTPDVVREYFNTEKDSSLTYENTEGKDIPYIKKVELETSLPNNVHLCGEEMKVNIDICTPYPINGACFSFQIVDSRERSFTHCWIFDSDRPFCRDKGTYRLSCCFPALKLYMGNYYLRCHFSEPPGGAVFERLENICPFQVVMYEAERTHFKWQPDTCAYLEDSFWDIKKIN
ncbi:MAG: ATP-binding cassette domain-containing protein [Chitinophagaceae bacterium]|nr:ATP-binding cassette domain-containing protein [Chitinophagaceae bacterium]